MRKGILAMKKSVLLCLISALAVGSSAQAANIEAQVKLRRVSVSISETVGAEIPTLQLLNADKSKMLYTGEGISDDNGYSFESFSFPMNAESGSYVLRLGENGTISETVIKYTAYDEALRALKSIESDKSTVSAQLAAYPELFGTTAADYGSLSSDWKKRLENDIVKIEIKYADEAEATETVNKISAAVKKITDWGTLTDSLDAEKIGKAIQAVSGLDTKYVEKLNSLSELHKGFAAQNIDEISIDDEGISSAFDGAVLVSIINGCDWGTGKEALSYYAEKGLVSVESKYLTSGSDVYKKLKEKNVLDYREIPGKIKEAYDEVNGSGSSGSGSGGGTPSGKVNRVSSAGSAASAPDSKPSFNDLDGAPWARTAIEALAEKKIISGRGNGSFAPNEPVTRAEFVKMIVMALNLTDETAEAEFDDVPKSAWYYRVVASAKKSGIVSGMSDNLFGAEEQIIRQDMAVIILRAAKLAGIDTSAESAAFTDSESISDYAAQAVGKLAAAGIISGMGDGTFSPRTNVTRAQAAQVIYTLLGRKG